MAQPLSDDQVGQELRKMTMFIKQEAHEKAREIEIRANEEFALEKSKLVRQETDAIDSQYEKKFKQAQMSQQITRSTVANKTRLKVLGARQNLLDDIFETAAQKLPEASKDKARYTKVLQNLILEGFYALNEPRLLVRARKADWPLVEKAIEAACEEYEGEVGKEIEAKIDEGTPLPAGIAGGVVVIGGQGKIDIDNTLDTRLELLKESALPSMRKMLFGDNPNRKFHD